MKIIEVLQVFGSIQIQSEIRSKKIIEVLQVLRSFLFVLVCRLVCYLVKAWVQNTIYTCFISWVGGSGKQISDDIFKWVGSRNNFEVGSDQIFLFCTPSHNIEYNKTKNNDK